jgi:hypothetical protein
MPPSRPLRGCQIFKLQIADYLLKLLFEILESAIRDSVGLKGVFVHLRFERCCEAAMRFEIPRSAQEAFIWNL